MNPETPTGSAQVGAVAAAASLLGFADAAVAQGQINEAIARFELDPSRPADVMGAAAYVWSRYRLPIEIGDVSLSGAKLDAASEAVMRFALVNPEIFAARLQGPASKNATLDYLIRTIVDGALADYAVESGARAPGAAPELQRGIEQRVGWDEAEVRKFIEPAEVIIRTNRRADPSNAI
jgi:hypothetical protein